MEISIRKSASGNSVGAGGSTLGPDSYSASTQSVLTADACYFTLNALTAQGKVIDVSQIEGGFGLYRLPCGSQPFNIDALEMVYPLNPTASVWHMAVNAAETQLLLFTDEGGQAWLTVIDLASMTEVQRLFLDDLATRDGDTAGWAFFDGEISG